MVSDPDSSTDTMVLITESHKDISFKENDTNDQCSVCMQEYTNDKFVTSCGHTFCIGCIIQWSDNSSKTVDENKHIKTTTCPMCRKEINIDDIKKTDQYKIFEKEKNKKLYIFCWLVCIFCCIQLFAGIGELLYLIDHYQFNVNCNYTGMWLVFNILFAINFAELLFLSLMYCRYCFEKENMKTILFKMIVIILVEQIILIAISVVPLIAMIYSSDNVYKYTGNATDINDIINDAANTNDYGMVSMQCNKLLKAYIPQISIFAHVHFYVVVIVVMMMICEHKYTCHKASQTNIPSSKKNHSQSFFHIILTLYEQS